MADAFVLTKSVERSEHDPAYDPDAVRGEVMEAVRRAESKVRKTSGSGMDDSDLAAIIPGPQPKPWDDEA